MTGKPGSGGPAGARRRARRRRDEPRSLVRRGRPAGTSRPALDNLDAAILAILQQDGRASLRQVARKLGASVTTVSTRVRHLVRLRVLQGFVPLVSVQRLTEIGRSPSCVMLFVRPRRRPPVELKRVADAVAEEPQVCYVFELAGGQELLALASTPSPGASQALVASLRRHPFIEGVRPLAIQRVHKERPNHPLGEPSLPMRAPHASGLA